MHVLPMNVTCKRENRGWQDIRIRYEKVLIVCTDDIHTKALSPIKPPSNRSSSCKLLTLSLSLSFRFKLTCSPLHVTILVGLSVLLVSVPSPSSKMLSDTEWNPLSGCWGLKRIRLSSSRETWESTSVTSGDGGAADTVLKGPSFCCSLLPSSKVCL